MIIEYELGYPCINTWAVCCGRFRDIHHFEVFTKIEWSYGRSVRWSKIIFLSA